tara:strand:- start:449 stop:985 length:537 start_codon:yes stop_codon:yes gene_type:complete
LLDPDPDTHAMATYDLIMLAIALFATLFGAWKGLAWQIAWVSAVAISSLVALQLRTGVANQLGMVGPAGSYFAMGIVFAAVSVIIWLLYRMGYSWIKRSGLGKFDRRMGGAAGILSGLLLCTLITVISMSVSGPAGRAQIQSSYSGRWISSLLTRSSSYLPGDVQQKVDDLLEEEVSS